MRLLVVVGFLAFRNQVVLHNGGLVVVLRIRRDAGTNDKIKACFIKRTDGIMLQSGYFLSEVAVYANSASCPRPAFARSSEY